MLGWLVTGSSRGFGLMSGGRGPASITVLMALALSVLGVIDHPAAASSHVTAAVTTPATKCVKPTIVLVHGAWADASSWSGEVDRLQSDGYVVRAIANPLHGLTSDAADVADFLKTIAGPIVLVGHSYGDSVITNAAAGNGNVKELVYVDAAAPAAGETTAQLSGKTSALGANLDTLYDSVPYPGASPGTPTYT